MEAILKANRKSMAGFPEAHLFEDIPYVSLRYVVKFINAMFTW